MNTFPNIHSAPYAYLPQDDLLILLAMFLAAVAINGIVDLAIKIAVVTFEVFAHAVEREPNERTATEVLIREQSNLCRCDRFDCDKKH